MKTYNATVAIPELVDQMVITADSPELAAKIAADRLAEQIMANISLSEPETWTATKFGENGSRSMRSQDRSGTHDFTALPVNMKFEYIFNRSAPLWIGAVGLFVGFMTCLTLVHG